MADNPHKGTNLGYSKDYIYLKSMFSLYFLGRYSLRIHGIFYRADYFRYRQTQHLSFDLDLLDGLILRWLCKGYTTDTTACPVILRAEMNI